MECIGAFILMDEEARRHLGENPIGSIINQLDTVMGVIIGRNVSDCYRNTAFMSWMMMFI